MTSKKIQIDATQVKRIVEAALFISGRWMTPEELAKVAGTGSIGAVKQSLEELTSEFGARNGGVRFSESDGKYRIEVDPDVRDKVYYLAPEPELSPALIKTLALIAYKQPITQGKVVMVIGNRAYDYIKELRKKEFISIRVKGRSKILTTTGSFSKYFMLEENRPWKPELGLDAKILEDAQKKLDEVIPEEDVKPSEPDRPREVLPMPEEMRSETPQNEVLEPSPDNSNDAKDT
jgi:segregation and condensation protein B